MYGSLFPEAQALLASTELSRQSLHVLLLPSLERGVRHLPVAVTLCLSVCLTFLVRMEGNVADLATFLLFPSPLPSSPTPSPFEWLAPIPGQLPCKVKHESGHKSLLSDSLLQH